jgi:hypothetical protein
MNRKIAMSQSNYAQWRGYFELINLLDTFIFYDDTQLIKRDCRKRNKTKTLQVSYWLTIFADVKGEYFKKFNQTQTNITK